MNRMTHLIIAGIFCLIAIAPIIPIVNADTGFEIDSVTIDAYETKCYSFELAENDGLYGRFRINYGDEIYFFIVDQNGHQEILSGKEASTGYLEKVYQRNNGEWHEWRFIAPHSSTWYVYYSKALFAPVSGETVCIEGYVKQDTDAPWLIVSLPEGNLTGTITITVQAGDEGFPISGISLYIDGVREKQYSLQDKMQISTKIAWDTSGYDEGEHSLTIQVWDQLGHSSSHSETVVVQHAEFPIVTIVIIVAAFALVGLVCLLIRRDD